MIMFLVTITKCMAKQLKEGRVYLARGSYSASQWGGQGRAGQTGAGGGGPRSIHGQKSERDELLHSVSWDSNAWDGAAHTRLCPPPPQPGPGEFNVRFVS